MRTSRAGDAEWIGLLVLYREGRVSRPHLRLQSLSPVRQMYVVLSFKYARGRRLTAAGNFSTSFQEASTLLGVVGLPHDAAVQAAHAPVSDLDTLTDCSIT